MKVSRIGGAVGVSMGAGLVVSVLSGSALGGSFDGVVDSGLSSAVLTGTTEVHNTGVLIGDFDAETNPDGTSTIPGLFGGSGNNPIGMELTGAVAADLDTNPTGSVLIDADFDLLTIDISGLVVDLLGGQAGAAQPSVSMIYDTFRTVNPSFLYLGGIPFEFPIGDGSTIDQTVLTQTGAGAGVLTPTADPDVFDFAMAVPAELAMSFTLGFGDFDAPAGEPTPVVLPLSGTIERLGDGGVLVVMGVETQQIAEDTPIEGVEVPAIPFELPTLGTETAGVLITLSPDLVRVDVSYGWSLVVNGAASACVADFTGDGVLDFFDVSAFLTAFGSGDSAADLTGDGALDFFDVSAFLAAFASGCP